MKTLILFLLAASSAFGGLIVHGTLTRGAQKGSIKQYFQDESARVDFKMHADDGSFIYQTRSGLISWVDHPRKSFIEMNKVDLDRVLAIFSGFIKQPALGLPTDVKFEKDPTLRTVGKWKCTRYSVMTKTGKVGQFCTVPMASVGASPSDYKALQSLITTILSLGVVPATERTFLESVNQALKLGFIVETVDLDPAGKPVGGMVIDSIAKEKIQTGLFASPAGYARKDITSLLQKAPPPSGK